MRTNKKTLYQNALKKFGKAGLFREAAVSLNDLSMWMLEMIKDNEPPEENEDIKDLDTDNDDFYDHLASAYISVQQLIEMIGWVKRQKLWENVHQQLYELNERVKSVENG
jgi:hypothetical protein